MTDPSRTGTIIIRTGTPLPPEMIIETEPFLPGWNAVKKLDGYELGRKMQSLGWNFFYLAGEVSATVVGHSDGTVRKAVERVLGGLKSRKFNSLEITKVVSKRFFGVPYVRVFAHFRHIQAGQYLAPAKDSFLKTSGPSPAEFGSGGNAQEPSAEIPAKQFATAVSGS